MARSIDLNCDMGEGSGHDEEILPHVTSINIACSYHAGDPATMRRMVSLAADHGVAIGAHPGLPDRAGFGRRVMQAAPQEVYDLVLYQAGALAPFARAAGSTVTHLKPHGALYNMAAKDAAVAQAVVQATRDFDPSCILVGLAGSELIKAGESAGLRTASEAFADRTYQADGSLTPRESADALIHDSAVAAERVLKMVLQGTVASQQGIEIPLRADTICIHGDSPSAATMAKAIRERLRQEGIEARRMTGIAGGRTAEGLLLHAIRSAGDNGRMQPLDILETCLYVSDLTAAERFYSQVLGLALHSRQDGRHVFFRCGRGMLLLFNPEQSSLPGEIPPHGAGGAGHVAFAAHEADLPAWQKHLEANGVAVERFHTWPGGGHSLYFRDQGGNSLELATPTIWGQA